MNIQSRIAAAVLGTLALGLAACGSSYYLVKDPHSGREYYATKVKHSRDGINFKDGKTLSMVTLENSEVIEISRDEYRASTRAP